MHQKNLKIALRISLVLMLLLIISSIWIQKPKFWTDFLPFTIILGLVCLSTLILSVLHLIKLKGILVPTIALAISLIIVTAFILSLVEVVGGSNEKEYILQCKSICESYYNVRYSAEVKAPICYCTNGDRIINQTVLQVI